MLLCWLQRIVSLLSYLIANRETVVMPAGIAGYFSRTIKIWVKVNPRWLVRAQANFKHLHQAMPATPAAKRRFRALARA